MKELESIESIGTFRAAAKAPFYVLECGERPTDAMLAHIKAAWHRIFPGNDRPELVILTDGLKLLYGDPTVPKPGGMLDSNGNAIPLCCSDALHSCTFADGRVAISCKEHGVYEIRRTQDGAPRPVDSRQWRGFTAGDISAVADQLNETYSAAVPLEQWIAGEQPLSQVAGKVLGCAHNLISEDGEAFVCQACGERFTWTGTKYKPIA